MLNAIVDKIVQISYEIWLLIVTHWLGYMHEFSLVIPQNKEFSQLIYTRIKNLEYNLFPYFGCSTPLQWSESVSNLDVEVLEKSNSLSHPQTSIGHTVISSPLSQHGFLLSHCCCNAFIKDILLVPSPLSIIVWKEIEGTFFDSYFEEIC